MAAVVLTALDHGWEGRMVEVVDRLPGITVGRRCVDLADLLAAASAGLGDVALVSADLRGLDRDALAHLRAAGVAVVGAGPDGQEAPERHLRQLGIERYVHVGTPREDLVDVLTSAAVTGAPFAGGAQETWPGEDPPTAPIAPVTDATPDPQAPPARGRVVAVVRYPDQADELLRLVLDGAKTATASAERAANMTHRMRRCGTPMSAALIRRGAPTT